MRFDKMTTNANPFTLRLLRIPTTEGRKKIVENDYRYMIAVTNLGGVTEIGKSFRTNPNVEEFVLNDSTTKDFCWQTDLSTINPNKEYLFRIKRPSWEITIKNRTHQYGIGKYWGGSILTDCEYLNIFAQREGVEFMELE